MQEIGKEKNAESISSQVMDGRKYYMEMIPKVLVLMSLYNGGKYLAEQIESIIGQEGVDVSLYVRDDGSEDNAEMIIHKYEKMLPIIYCKEANIGAARSFMRLVELAEDGYDYYAFADQDDSWDHDKLYTAVQKMKDTERSPALYYSNTRRVGQNLEKIKELYKKVYHTERFPDVLIVTEAPGCTMVFDKSLLTILKKYIPAHVYMHDCWVLQVCAAIGGTIIYDANPHMLYRQHADNVMAGLEKMQYNPFQLFRYRIHKLFDFSYRPSSVAAELKAGYYDLMDSRNRRAVQLLIDAPNCLKDRIYILLTNKIATPYWVHNVKWKLQVLLNKL